MSLSETRSGEDTLRLALHRIGERDAELAARGPHLDDRSVLAYLRGELDDIEGAQEHLTHCRRCQDLAIALGRTEKRRRVVTPRGWQAWAPGDRRGPRDFDSWLRAACYWLRSWVRSWPLFDRRKA